MTGVKQKRKCIILSELYNVKVATEGSPERHDSGYRSAGIGQCKKVNTINFTTEIHNVNIHSVTLSHTVKRVCLACYIQKKHFTPKPNKFAFRHTSIYCKICREKNVKNCLMSEQNRAKF